MSTPAPSTNHNSLVKLSKSIINRLEHSKCIVFDAKERNALSESLLQDLAKVVLTEEDITDMVRKQVSAHSDMISDSNITETEAFRSQKRSVKEKYGDNVLHGFYFKETLKSVSERICRFLMSSDLVEDVFESDDVIQKMLLDTFKNFDEAKIA